jgi:hypothetical protein
VSKRKKRYRNLGSLISRIRRIQFEQECRDFGKIMAEEITKEIDKEIVEYLISKMTKEDWNEQESKAKTFLEKRPLVL